MILHNREIIFWIRIFFLTLLSLLSFESHAQREISSESLKLIVEKNIKENGVDPIEGIWVGTQKIEAFFVSSDIGSKKLWDPKTFPITLGIVRNGQQYQVYNISRSTSGFQHSDIEISKENNRLKFNSNDYVGSVVLRQHGALEITMIMKKEAIGRILGEIADARKNVKCFSEIKLNKSYPLENDINYIKAKIVRQSPRSGTGFALTSDGYIATNYHVVEDAARIMVRGVNGNFDSGLRAEVIKSDQSADVAILKIADSDFLTLGRVPYPVISHEPEVGEDVFALGYPLMKTMGEEVKLATGVISANSGFEGTQKQFQISIPVQPGNSGGPLFDKKGRVVGIISAKHKNTDNVSYAVKGLFLTSLFYTISSAPVLDEPVMTVKTLPEQVKKVKNFIYIIETNL